MLEPEPLTVQDVQADGFPNTQDSQRLPIPTGICRRSALPSTMRRVAARSTCAPPTPTWTPPGLPDLRPRRDHRGDPRRERIVFDWCRSRGVPVAYVRPIGADIHPD